MLTTLSGTTDLRETSMDTTYVATLTCPKCGTKHAEMMTDDSCQFFYRCATCGAMLRAADGDCCVFCSYADVPCPPIQRECAANRV